MRIGASDEAELDAAAKRLEGLGVSSQIADGKLLCIHPGHDWAVSIEVTDPISLTPPPLRATNRPGERGRSGKRAEVIIEGTHRPPRRLAHVVMGSPDPIAATKFFREGIGMRVSDEIGGGMATFMRCSTDHHNLLIHPGPVPYLNHYAFEFDDVDAVGAASGAYLADRSDDHHVIGLGRHVVGANVFWYMKDPCGTMFEFFSDMDNIVDDDAWEIGTDWAPNAFATWGPNEPPEVFFAPADLPDIAKAREEEGV
jgi:catechol 2,3-dioxygenase-like lactoylglutathione lyase family enzyme